VCERAFFYSDAKKKVARHHREKGKPTSTKCLYATKMDAVYKDAPGNYKRPL
jgi:hypothetical protein